MNDTIKQARTPDGVAQLVEASSCAPKGCRIDPQSGHKPKLWVWSPVRACMRGNQSMFLSLPSSLFFTQSSGEGENKKQAWNCNTDKSEYCCFSKENWDGE